MVFTGRARFSRQSSMLITKIRNNFNTMKLGLVLSTSWHRVMPDIFFPSKLCGGQSSKQCLRTKSHTERRKVRKKKVTNYTLSSFHDKFVLREWFWEQSGMLVGFLQHWFMPRIIQCGYVLIYRLEFRCWMLNNHLFSKIIRAISQNCQFSMKIPNAKFMENFGI